MLSIATNTSWLLHDSCTINTLLPPVDHMLITKMKVGKTFFSFVEFKVFSKKKTLTCYMYLVNSQTTKDYNRKHPTQYIDEERFRL